VGTQVLVLGPIEVRTAVGTARLTGQRARLLAALVLAGTTGLSLSRLIDWLWDDPPPTARQQVHKLAAALRQIDPELIVTAGAGYRLNAERVWCDTTEFQRLAATSEPASLTAALRLWRGHALTGVDGKPAVAASQAWEERRVAVVERVTRQRIGGQDPGAVISELDECIAAHPTRETLHVLLMLALHRSGRTVDALAHFAQVRRLLADEFGVDPGAELSALHDRLLRGGEPVGPAPLGVAAVGDTDAKPATSSSVGAEPMRTLPFDVPDFTGRAADLQRLVEVAGRAGVIAVDGMPGVGKTALAIHLTHLLADRYPDGTLFIDLAAHSPAGTAVDTATAARLLLEMIGVPESGWPTDPLAVNALWRSRAAARRMIVVLDNAGSAATVAPLLSGDARPLVLVTSRARLTDLDGATFHSLAVLGDDEAVELFNRVLAAGGTRKADAAGVPDSGDENDLPDVSGPNEQGAVELVRWCAGLPLAIRLVAGRLARRPGWTMADLAVSLRDDQTRRSLLHGPQSRIQVAFDSAFDHLEDASRRALVLLAGAPMSEFDVSAAAALLGTTRPATLPILEQLVDAHLIEPLADSRYGFHDLVREYASDRRSDRQAFVAEGRLRDYYLAAVTLAVDHLNPTLRRFRPRLDKPPAALPSLHDRESALDWLHREHRTLVRLASTGVDWQLACLLRVYFEVRGHFGDWLSTHRYAMSVVGDDRAGQGYLAMNLGGLASWQGDPDTGIREYQAAAELLADQPALAAGAYATIAMLQHQRFDDRAAMKYARRALSIPEADSVVRALAWCNLGLATARTGGADAAMAMHRRALMEADNSGDLSVRCAVNLGLGETSLRLGQQASGPFRTAFALAEQQSNRIQQAIALDGLAHATRKSVYWQSALDIYTALGVPQADLVRRHLSEPDRPHCDLCSVSWSESSRSGAHSPSRLSTAR
jgi:DNA-binding SARP family transcriptional activator